VEKVEGDRPFHRGQGDREEIPLAYRATRGGIWVAAGSFWQLAFGFIANVLLVRLLFPADFGQFALAMFFAQLLRVQSRLGLGYAFARHREMTGEAIGTYVISEMAASFAGIAVMLFASPILLYLGYAGVVVKVAVALSFLIVVEAMGGIGSTILDKELFFKQTSILRSVLFPLSYLPAFWCAMHGGGVWSIVVQGLTNGILFTMAVWVIARRQLPEIFRIKWRFDPILARSFLRFGVTVGFGTLAGMLLTQMDNFFVGTLTGVAVLGLYERAYRLAEWPGSIFNNVINRSVFFTYSKIRDNPLLLEKTVAMVLWGITTITLPIALAVFIVAPDLLLTLYGEQWVAATPFLRLLVIYAFLRPFWENGGVFFIAMGKPKVTTICNGFQAAILFLLGLPFTLLWGATGTCLAVAASFVAGVIFLYAAMSREIGLNHLKLFAGPFAAAGLTVAGYLVFEHLATPSLLPLTLRLLVKTVYIGLAFCTFTVMLQPVTTVLKIRYIARLVRGKDPLPEEGDTP
jgi:lipopolysaccharide exporter